MLASHSSADIWLGQHWKSACGKSETWVTVAGENCVWAKKEKKLQQQQQNGVVLDLALKEIPVPVQIHFVCEEIFGRMSQLKASSCLFTESQDAADILSKSFLTLDLPIYRICAR